MWFHIAHTLFLILLVFRIRTLEIEYFRIAFESEYVRTDTGEKPAVVRNYNGTNGDVAFVVEGRVQSLLQTERLMLNVMQRMSGIATMTHRPR